MAIDKYTRGIPTYKGKDGLTYGHLVETKESCITDDNGVSLSDKLANIVSGGGGASSEELENIINGTTTVGNANKLGGKNASEYALDTDLENYLPKNGGTATGDIIVNKKSTTMVATALGVENIGGRIQLLASSGGNTGLYDPANSAWVVKKGTDGTVTYATGTMDGQPILHTGNVGSYALPLSGGKIDGNLEISTTTEEKKAVILGNAKRRVWFEVESDGTCDLWDTTKGKAIFSANLDGTNTFNGTATNATQLDGKSASAYRKTVVEITAATADLNSYNSDGVYYFGTSTTLTNAPGTTGWLEVNRLAGASSLTQRWIERSSSANDYIRVKNGSSWSAWRRTFTSSGGTVTDNITVDKQSSSLVSTAVEVKNTGGRIQLIASSGGNLGLYDPANGTWIVKKGTDGSVTYADTANVKIQSTAPTDTSALWVDSSNKKTKAYIDGAWTALA